MYQCSQLPAVKLHERTCVTRHILQSSKNQCSQLPAV